MFRLVRYKKLLLSIGLCSIILVIILTNYENRSIGIAADDNKYKGQIDDNPRLAIIVPFRDRFDELMIFVPHISEFLKYQGLSSRFKIYIINQSRKYRFNRGSLINVGFQLAKNESDYIAMHDVDLLPINANLSYKFPKSGPYHLSSPEYHPLYNYPSFFGGILVISNEHYKLVNGMSNKYFGWGMEDDEFYTRIKSANLPIDRPKNLTTNRNNTFLHYHYGRKRDMVWSNIQKSVLRRRDRITGLRDLKFTLVSSRELTIDKRYHCHVFDVEISCDMKSTPWCVKGSQVTPSVVDPKSEKYDL